MLSCYASWFSAYGVGLTLKDDRISTQPYAVRQIGSKVLLEIKGDDTIPLHDPLRPSMCSWYVLILLSTFVIRVHIQPKERHSLVLETHRRYRRCTHDAS